MPQPLLEGSRGKLATFPFLNFDVQIDPEDFETNFNIGILYYTDTASNKKDYAKAVHHLKTAIEQERSATAMFNLAVIYEEQGERVAARELYQEVSTLLCN